MSNTTFADSEIQELAKLDPREAFPYYFEGEDGQEMLNIGAATEPFKPFNMAALSAPLRKEVARIVYSAKDLAVIRAEMDADEIPMN